MERIYFYLFSIFLFFSMRFWWNRKWREDLFSFFFPRFLIILISSNRWHAFYQIVQRVNCVKNDWFIYLFFFLTFFFLFNNFDKVRGISMWHVNFVINKWFYRKRSKKKLEIIAFVVGIKFLSFIREKLEEVWENWIIVYYDEWVAIANNPNHLIMMRNAILLFRISSRGVIHLI